jgi:UDP-N-acetyl-D-glucosamine/UDP-N-acetyl-D-galactosamine dehydrogenase
LGLTFKENCNDIRNTKVVDIIEELKSYHVDVLVHDPLADPEDVSHEYGLTLTKWEDIKQADAMILAVAHDFYIQNNFIAQIINKLENPKLIIDIKSVLDRAALSRDKVTIWRL